MWTHNSDLVSWLCSLGLGSVCSGHAYLATAWCAPSSGTLTPPTCSPLVCATGGSTERRSGTMCSPSTVGHGGGASTYSAPDSHVSPSPSQASGEPMTTRATGGPPRTASLARYDLQSSGWRTSQVSLMGVTDISARSSVDWPRWGMTRCGACWALETSARHIGGIASSCSLSTPTPTAGDSRSTRNLTLPARRTGEQRANAGTTLTDFVTLAPHPHTTLPTPSASNYGSNRSASAGVSVRPSLHTMARTGAWSDRSLSLPTPAARDWKDCAAPSEYERNTPGLAARAGGKLNPQWVEWLMGVPIGWSDSRPLATDKYLCRSWPCGASCHSELDDES
jgi:hypothetical protein